jgi:deoxyribonuclease-4
MFFGTAGIPLQCPERNSLNGIKWDAEHGLRAFEFEFVQGVRVGKEAMRECGKAAEELRVSLSAHAPYFVNLISEEEHKRIASKERILQTARAVQEAGGGRIVFHPGFYGKMNGEQAMKEMREEFSSLVSLVEKEGLDEIVLAPETTGKGSAFGSLQELLDLSREFGLNKVNLCIDFGHLHARGNGELKTREKFEEKISLVKSRLGEKGLKSLHCHFTGIAFSEKGERHHLEISSKSPDFNHCALALRKFDCDGTIISESPNIESDAMEMKGVWESGE